MTEKTSIKDYLKRGEDFRIALDCWSKDFTYSQYHHVVTKVVQGFPKERILSEKAYKVVFKHCQDDFKASLGSKQTIH